MVVGREADDVAADVEALQVVEPPYRSWFESPLAATLMGEALALGYLGMFLYYQWVAGHLREATIVLSQPGLVPGTAVTIKLSQVSRASLRIQEQLIALASTVRIGRNTQRHVAISWSVRTDFDAHPGEPLHAEVTFDVPPDLNEISNLIANSWRLEVHTRVAERPDYRASFPVLLSPGAGAT